MRCCNTATEIYWTEKKACVMVLGVLIWGFQSFSFKSSCFLLRLVCCCSPVLCKLVCFTFCFSSFCVKLWFDFLCYHHSVSSVPVSTHHVVFPPFPLGPFVLPPCCASVLSFPLIVLFVTKLAVLIWVQCSAEPFVKIKEILLATPASQSPAVLHISIVTAWSLCTCVQLPNTQANKLLN